MISTPMRSPITSSHTAWCDRHPRGATPMGMLGRGMLGRGMLGGCNGIVFLAPPHSGLPAARLASPIAQRFLPPMLDLSDAPTSYVNTLPTTINHDVGAIAARWDVLVPRRSTHLDCQRRTPNAATRHTNSLLVSRRVATLVANFLHRGSFDATL